MRGGDVVGIEREKREERNRMVFRDSLILANIYKF